MPRLIETKEPRPEYSTVINWTVPVYIKNGEDYYKVCFDIKRKPLSDGTLPMSDEDFKDFYRLWRGFDTVIEIRLDKNADNIVARRHNGTHIDIKNYKAILWLNERFDLGEDK